MAAAVCRVPRASTTTSLLLTCPPDLLTSCSSPKDGFKVWAFTSMGYNFCTGLLMTTGLPLVITHTLAHCTTPSLPWITSSTSLSSRTPFSHSPRTQLPHPQHSLSSVDLHTYPCDIPSSQSNTHISICSKSDLSPYSSNETFCSHWVHTLPPHWE